MFFDLIVDLQVSLCVFQCITMLKNQPELKSGAQKLLCRCPMYCAWMLDIISFGFKCEVFVSVRLRHSYVDNIGLRLDVLACEHALFKIK